MNVYLEGGPLLRPTMKTLLLRAVNTIYRQSVVLNVIPCGSGDDAIRKCSRDSNAVLLIDSEGVLTTQLAEGVNRQVGGNHNVFFMVQLMESWFLADQPMLESYYGRGFSVRSLPANPNIEDIPKLDVERGLRNATRRCSKGAYSKTTHAPDLLNQLDPTTVYNACPNFALLIDYLRVQAAV